MFALIAHEIEGRIRFATQGGLSDKEASALHYAITSSLDVVDDVRIYRKTGSVAIAFSAREDASLADARQQVIDFIGNLDRSGLEQMRVPMSASILFDENYYPEKITSMVVGWIGRRLFLPLPVRMAYDVIRAAPYLYEGARTLMARRIDVSVIDAAAIGFALLTRDMNAVSEIIFLLNLGEVFEEWTERKSTADLANSLLDQDMKAWVIRDDIEQLVPVEEVQAGETIVCRMGYTIPVDGVVVRGTGEVNQASLTGESVSIVRTTGDSVYAGTVLEEGELIVQTKATSKETRLMRIMHMIDDAADQKSTVESRVNDLADAIVPYNLAFGLLVGLITRNIHLMSAAFVVDYSCALKLATSISVLSAMREGASRGFTIKGGRQLEQLAHADTIVFDKTGTLTNATPQVTNVIGMNGNESKEVLRLSACLEEHFPHPVARAIVNAAAEQDLKHREQHSDVEYIVAHGIVSSLDGHRILIGSPHFIFDDEGVVLCPEARAVLEAEDGHQSVLFLARDKEVMGAIVLEDPLREDAPAMIADLRKAGFEHIVMLTGDAESAARQAAAKAGVDEYRSQVMPEDKANFIKDLQKKGRKVVMVGDGINDSLALTTADVGIAMNNGADVAREVADITFNTNDLNNVLMLRLMSQRLFRRMDKTYSFIMVVNTILLGLGVTGTLSSGASALLHNSSTVGVGLSSMRNLYPLEETPHSILKHESEQLHDADQQSWIERFSASA